MFEWFSQKKARDERFTVAFHWYDSPTHKIELFHVTDVKCVSTSPDYVTVEGLPGKNPPGPVNIPFTAILYFY